LAIFLLVGGWSCCEHSHTWAETELSPHPPSQLAMVRRLLEAMCEETDVEQQMDLLRRSLQVLEMKKGCDRLFPQLEKVLRTMDTQRLERTVATLKRTVHSEDSMRWWCVVTLDTMLVYVRTHDT
jgi:phosphoglycolate phosphatase-like HAD superfamily hydrolase